MHFQISTKKVLVSWRITGVKVYTDFLLDD